MEGAWSSGRGAGLAPAGGQEAMRHSGRTAARSPPAPPGEGHLRVHQRPAAAAVSGNGLQDRAADKHAVNLGEHGAENPLRVGELLQCSAG